MQLISPTKQHIQQIMNWFPNQQATSTWGGPHFRYPFTEASFVEDLKLDSLASNVIADAQGNCLAFGQYYKRVGRCHLGRLVVSPMHRGQGIGEHLIHGLITLGTATFKVNESSLFVFNDNLAAKRLYQRLGFMVAEYPEPMPMDNCLYMICRR